MDLLLSYTYSGLSSSREPGEPDGAASELVLEAEFLGASWSGDVVLLSSHVSGALDILEKQTHKF